MQPAALKTPRKCCQTWPGQADKKFQGRTKIIAEKFCPKIKIFGGRIFFLTVHVSSRKPTKKVCDENEGGGSRYKPHERNW